jgi:RNA polymerase sigma-70 factor (ECF subfamily)
MTHATPAMPAGRTEPTTGETRLIAMARQGHDAAWEEIVRTHQEAVFRLAYLIAGNAADAEDVAQSVFIRAYLKLDQYDDSRPLRPWLLGITANQARNKRRSIGRYWHMVGRFLDAHRAETITEPPADRADAELLWQAVRRLPEGSRSVIYLRYFLDLSEAETAQTLDIAPGTVKSRTHRAMKKLRQIIKSEYPELADERI